MRVYISGPITGYENGNRPAFYEAKESLVNMGYEVVVPFDNNTNDEESEVIGDNTSNKYWDILIKDIRSLLKVQGIVFIPEWETSKGARVEAYIGLINGLPMWEFHDNNTEVYLEELKHSYVAGVCAAQWAPRETLIQLGLVDAA